MYFNESQFSGIIFDDTSDHLPIFFVTQNKVQTHAKFLNKSARLVNEKTISNLTSKLQAIDWSILDNKDTNDAYDTFYDTFCSVYNESIPVQTKRYKVHSNKCKPWITTGILKSIRRKHKLYKKSLLTKSDNRKNLYLKYKNKLTKIIRAAEKRYYLDKFTLIKDNMRDTWKLINNVLNDTIGSGYKSSVAKIKHNNIVLDDPKIIAEKFNEFFINIGPNLAKNIPLLPNKSIKDTLPEPNKNSMFLAPCTPTEIINLGKTLKNSKGVGLDGLKSSVIKQIIASISGPLTIIFNKSLASGIFPHKLKLAKVTPVYKSEDKMLVSNYRPISVLPVFFKNIREIDVL